MLHKNTEQYVTEECLYFVEAQSECCLGMKSLACLVVTLNAQCITNEFFFQLYLGYTGQTVEECC